VRDVEPSVLFHLAGLASPRKSWQTLRETLRDNTQMTLNVLEAVRTEAPGARVVLIGSGQIYGAPERLPVDEDAPLRPENPYAVSKVACDLLGGLYAGAHGLAVGRTRSFNHAGPGQSDEYLIGTLTRQVAEAELAGRDEVTIRTGPLDSARDFTDVRDVVRAYVAAAEAPPGAYNVCSGRSVALGELVEMLGDCTSMEIRHEVDPARIRPNDVKEIRGSAERLRRATGWTPEIPIEQTIRDAIEAWRTKLASKPAARHV